MKRDTAVKVRKKDSFSILSYVIEHREIPLLGVLAALRQNSWLDYTLMGLAMTGHSYQGE